VRGEPLRSAPRSVVADWSRMLPSTARWLLFCSLAGGAALAQPPEVGGALPGPLPLFPPGHWWNVDVSQAPVDPGSAALLQFIGATRGLHPDFGGDAGTGPEIYGLPYVTVPGSQPRVPVSFYYYDESDPGEPGGPAGYPIPEQAKTQAKWIEGGYPGNVDAGGDRHLLIVDRDQRLLFELYDVLWTGSQWTAGSGAVWPLGESRRRPDGWTSADAAGLEILPGLVRYDEAYGTEPIRHAFRVTTRATDGYVFPASHRAGDTAGAPPMGARLRLKAGKDLSGYAEPVRRIFQAMKTHGLVVADNGSDLYVTGTYDPRWDNDLLNPAFASLKGSDFEVIQLGWQPAGGGGGGGTPEPCVASATKLCLNGGRFHVSVVWRDFFGNSGAGQAVTETSDSGLFWFFSENNLEVLVKVLDGCGVNDRYRVFAAATTSVEYDLTVKDADTGAEKSWHNALGVSSPAITDVNALAVCP
jgi:hypothetical protein